jgi:cytochrome c peroxidase
MVRHGRERPGRGQPHLRQPGQDAGRVPAHPAPRAGSLRRLRGRSGTERQRAIFSEDEEAGLRLFLGKGKCIDCHNGPRFTNDDFHNTAIPGIPGVPLDLGRADGLRRLQADPFNCAGLYSDADLEECTALRFLKTTGDTIEGAHKTPTLRNVAATAPYMHTGQFPDLRSVLEHYSDGGLALVGHNELEPLDLTATEMEQLEAFLHTLTQE